MSVQLHPRVPVLTGYLMTTAGTTPRDAVDGNLTASETRAMLAAVATNQDPTAQPDAFTVDPPGQQQ